MAKVNKAASDLIKEYEGLRLTAYKCAADKWTIGYGVTAGAGVGITPKAGMVITEAQADKYFELAIDKFADGVAKCFTVPVNENQFGACVSLAYNIGIGAFAKSSIVKNVNAGEFGKAANAFLLYNKAGGKVLNGLQRRRKAERELFLKPVAVVEPAKVGWLAAIWGIITGKAK